MTPSQSFVSLHSPAGHSKPAPSHAALPVHLHRDIAFVSEPFTRPEIFATDDSSQVSSLLQIALAALTLPAIAYSFSQMWSLMSGDTLLHAIRAIVP